MSRRPESTYDAIVDGGGADAVEAVVNFGMHTGLFPVE